MTMSEVFQVAAMSGESTDELFSRILVAAFDAGAAAQKSGKLLPASEGQLLSIFRALQVKEALPDMATLVKSGPTANGVEADA